MYKKVLVPLDGSDLAECVLPHVEAIATGCKVSAVIFLRVVEPFHMLIGLEDSTSFSEAELRRMNSESFTVAKDYLDHLTNRIQYKGVSIQTEVISGNVAESIVDYTLKNSIDLIIIATHGRSGVDRWVRGSIADRVLHAASAPILMVRALDLNK